MSDFTQPFLHPTFPVSLVSIRAKVNDAVFFEDPFGNRFELCHRVAQ